MTDTTWRRQAACRSVDPDVMHPDDTPTAITAAKRVCHGCPVVAACLRAALDAEEPWGVWGGFTHLERNRLRAGVPAKQCERCNALFVPPLPTWNRCPACPNKRLRWAAPTKTTERKAA